MQINVGLVWDPGALQSAWLFCSNGLSSISLSYNFANSNI